MSIYIRPFQSEDAEAIVALFRDTVRRVNCRDYTSEQTRAWAPDDMDVDRWRRRLLDHVTFVADLAGQVAGFANLARDGHVDCFYVSADHQNQGVGRLLMTAIDATAHELGLARLFSEVSITARPFFARHGFVTLAEQQVECRGVTLVNYRMEKHLKPIIR